MTRTKWRLMYINVGRITQIAIQFQNFDTFDTFGQDAAQPIALFDKSVRVYQKINKA